MQQVINIGAATGDGTGDKGQVPGIKVNANCTELYSSAVFLGTDSGAANAYVVSTFAPQPALPVSLGVGMMLRFTPGAGNGNTGPSTLNFAGTGVRNIVNSLGEALLGGEFVAGTPTIVIWNGASWVQQLLSIAALSQVLEPQTAQELLAGVTPANYLYPPGNILRYGASSTASDNTAALNLANSIGIPLTIPPGTYACTGSPVFTVPLTSTGGILQPASGTTIVVNGRVSSPGQIFDCSLGGTITGKLEALIIPVEWFGAAGNGCKGNTGVLVSSAVFTDSHAAFAAADVGKAIFIAGAPGTTNASFLGTIAGYVSSTTVNLSAAATWSGTGLSYYYGTDDTSAILAANATVGQITSYLGPNTQYNLNSQVCELAFTGANLYLVTSGMRIAGTNSAAQWRGHGGMPTIAFGIASSSTNCLTMGASASTSSASVENLTLDGNFTGQDLLAVEGYQSPRVRNVQLFYAARNGLAFTPPAGSWIQQGDFQNINILSSGVHNVYLNPAGASGPSAAAFVNECNFLNLDMQGCSARANSGAALYVTSGGGTFESWTIMNYKATAILVGSFTPSGSPFVFEANGFSEVGITFINGYSEGGTSGSPIGATSAPFYVNPSYSAMIRVRGYYSNYWGMQISHADHDAASSFTVASSAVQTLCTMQANDSFAADFFITASDNSGNWTYRRYAVIGLGFGALGSGSANATLIGTAAGAGTPPTITVAASIVSTMVVVNVTNGSAGPLTISYVASNRDVSAPPVYVY
jgi:hypothetical protein